MPSRPAIARWLAALLLASTTMVPFAHAARHGQAEPSGAAPTYQAWCDFCHQPFVAVAAASTEASAVQIAAPHVGAAPRALALPPLPTPPARGPPACC